MIVDESVLQLIQEVGSGNFDEKKHPENFADLVETIVVSDVDVEVDEATAIARNLTDQVPEGDLRML